MKASRFSEIQPRNPIQPPMKQTFSLRKPPARKFAYTLVELVVVMLIVALVMAAVGDIYAQCMIRWGLQTARALATRKYAMLNIALTNEIHDAMKMQKILVNGNAVFEFTLPSATGNNYAQTWTGGWCRYQEDSKVRFYLSDTTGDPAVVGGGVIWRATAPAGSTTFTPDPVWTRDSAGNPFYDGVEILDVTFDPVSNAVRVRVKGVATEGVNSFGFEQTWGIMMRRANSNSVYIPIVPTSTYLQISGETLATDAPPIDLQAYDFSPGDQVVLEVVGFFKQSLTGSDNVSTTLGVFSSSPTLLASTNLNRVPGAVAPNFADNVWTVTTSHRFVGNNDIAQDFQIGNNYAVLTIPAGARYLFLAPGTDFYSDATDPDGDYGVHLYKY